MYQNLQKNALSLSYFLFLHLSLLLHHFQSLWKRLFSFEIGLVVLVTILSRRNIKHFMISKASTSNDENVVASVTRTGAGALSLSFLICKMKEFNYSLYMPYHLIRLTQACEIPRGWSSKASPGEKYPEEMPLGVHSSCILGGNLLGYCLLLKKRLWDLRDLKKFLGHICT